MKIHGAYSNHHKHGFGFAGILILIGIVLLSMKLNLFTQGYSTVIMSWPMILIVIGIYKLFKREFYSSITLLSIGGFFLVPYIASVPNSFIQGLPQNYFGTYWPVLLIIGGVLLVLRRTFFPKNCCNHSSFPHHGHGKVKDTFENTDGYIYKNSAFQSSEHIILDPEFKGGEINSSFGEITIDLRKTKLTEGTSILEIKVTFGAITIYVPEDWYVQPQIDAVFGSFEDKRYGKSYDTNTTKKLIIQGNVSFGGGEIRN